MNYGDTNLYSSSPWKGEVGRESKNYLNLISPHPSLSKEGNKLSLSPSPWQGEGGERVYCKLWGHQPLFPLSLAGRGRGESVKGVSPELLQQKSLNSRVNK